MKKLGKILGLLIIAATAFTAMSCKRDADYKEVTYTFKMTDNKISFIYYTSNQHFSYKSSDEAHNDCLYQFSFKPVGATGGTFQLYTRPASSPTVIESVLKGTYEASDVSKEGSIKLLVDEKEYQTIEAKLNEENELVFTFDVADVHNIIGAGAAK